MSDGKYNLSLDVDQDGVHQGMSGAETVESTHIKRRCKICKTRLSSYNLNKYCFAHMMKGLEQEEKEELRIRQERARIQQERVKRERRKHGKKSSVKSRPTAD